MGLQDGQVVGGGGHIGNSKTVAQADAHFSTNGGGLHFVNVAHESLQASAYYQYQEVL